MPEGILPPLARPSRMSASITADGGLPFTGLFQYVLHASDSPPRFVLFKASKAA
jgi:hypothetical protein